MKSQIEVGEGLIECYERIEGVCSRIEQMTADMKQQVSFNRSEVTFFKLLLQEKLSTPLPQLGRPVAVSSSGPASARVPVQPRTVAPESNGDWRPCNINKAALLARYTVGGTFRTELSGLRTQGCVSGANSEAMTITELGLSFGPFEQMPDTAEARIEWWKAHQSIGLCQRYIIDALHFHVGGLDITELARLTGYEVGTTFRTELSGLRTAGVIVGRNSQKMTLNPDMFA